jgi:hypothetical protein
MTKILFLRTAQLPLTKDRKHGRKQCGAPN